MIHCLNCGLDADLDEDRCEQCGGVLSEPNLADLGHLLENSRRELKQRAENWQLLQAKTESRVNAVSLLLLTACGKMDQVGDMLLRFGHHDFHKEAIMGGRQLRNESKNLQDDLKNILREEEKTDA